MSSKRKQAQDSRNTAAVSTASALQLDKALGDVSSASILVQGLFGKISETLVTKHSELKAVVNTIELRSAELADLHTKDKILLSIDDLNIEFSKERDRISQEREESRKELQRQDEALTYNINQGRKAADDIWNEKLRVREREFRIRTEDFDKDLKAKHDELKAIDLTYKTAIAKAESFDEVVKKEAAQQTAIACNVLKKDHNHQLEIINLQNKATVEGLISANARLQITLDKNEATIISLQKQLAAAQEAQTKLATDAVSAAANQKGMADMQSLITNIGGPNGTRKSS